MTRGARALMDRPRPRWAVAFFRWYAARRLRKGLDGVYVRGLEDLRSLLERGPVIVALNHTSWWDILLIIWLDGVLAADARAVMDARNLSRLPYFGLIGAVPLERRDREQAWRDLEAIAKLLNRPNRLVFIYPQGRHRQTGVRPLGFKGGVCFLAAQAGVPVVPVAVYYGFRETESVAATMDIRAPLEPPSDADDAAWRTRLEDAVELGLEAGMRWLDAPKLTSDEAFFVGLPPAKGAHQDGVAARMLGWMIRLFSGRSHG